MAAFCLDLIVLTVHDTKTFPIMYYHVRVYNISLDNKITNIGYQIFIQPIWFAVEHKTTEVSRDSHA